jgi:signal transduction histidine kinase
MSSDVTSQRFLLALERLLALPATEIHETLNHAADVVATALDAEKVDAFLIEPTHQVLAAIGTGDTAMSRAQVAAGLHVMPIANGGRAAQVYLHGEPFRHGHVDEDPEELIGIRERLGVRSELMAPIDIGGVRRGVLAVASTMPEFFSDEDLRFVVAIARWVGAVAHRAELVEQIESRALREGRRMAAEELVTILAHDLRGYLNAINGRIALVSRRAQREARGPDIHDLARASAAVHALDHLVTELLDTARLEKGLFSLVRQPIDLVALARETGANLATPDVSIVFEGPEEIVLSGDVDRLRQLLTNLISNAIQHSPKGRSVRIRVSTETEVDRSTRLALLDVEDDGPGLPPEILPQLFERFARGRESEGLGLGLYLAKRIAVLHGGDLTADCSPGRGARFRLRLPCDPSEACESREAP